MKKLLIGLIVLLLSTTASSAPFLVCDDPAPEQQVIEYEVFQDGVSIGKTPAPLHFDLKDITPGVYNFTVTAKNEWGTSNPSDPYVSPQIAEQPSNVNITP